MQGQVKGVLMLAGLLLASTAALFIPGSVSASELGATARNVYIDCATGIGIGGSYVPRRHPGSCSTGQNHQLAGSPPSVNFLHARWSHWGESSAVATAHFVGAPVCSRYPGSCHGRIRLFGIDRGCKGRRYYTRSQVSFAHMATRSFKLPSTCKEPTFFH
jgi:hypothetical protein